MLRTITIAQADFVKAVDVASSHGLTYHFREVEDPLMPKSVERVVPQRLYVDGTDSGYRAILRPDGTWTAYYEFI